MSLGVNNECPGMLTEQKVLDQEASKRNYIPGEEDAVSASEIQLHEKRTRFSLSHDQDSIGQYCSALLWHEISMFICLC